MWTVKSVNVYVHTVCILMLIHFSNHVSGVLLHTDVTEPVVDSYGIVRFVTTVLCPPTASKQIWHHLQEVSLFVMTYWFESPAAHCAPRHDLLCFVFYQSIGTLKSPRLLLQHSSATFGTCAKFLLALPSTIMISEQTRSA